MANIVEKIAESVKALGITANYGDPVTIDGVELIPVSLVYFGFGGGSDDEGGMGGGGGVSVPIGAYVGGGAGGRFQPNLIALIAVSIPATVVLGKSLSMIIRALKK